MIGSIFPSLNPCYHSMCIIDFLHVTSRMITLFTSNKEFVLLDNSRHELIVLFKSSLMKDIRYPSTAITSRSFCIFTDSNLFVISSMWDSAFHIYKFDQNSLNHVFSMNQNNSLILSLCALKNNMLLTSWRDSTLILWNLNDIGTNTEPVYKISPHHDGLTLYDANDDLGLIISCDKTKNIVLSDLVSGQFIRTFHFQKKGVITNIVLFSSGYVAFATEKSKMDVNITKICIYSINSNYIGSYKVISKLKCWCKIEPKSGSQLLALAFENGKINIIRVSSIKEILSYRTDKIVISMNFNQELFTCFCVDKEGSIYALDLKPKS